MRSGDFEKGIFYFTFFIAVKNIELNTFIFFLYIYHLLKEYSDVGEMSSAVFSKSRLDRCFILLLFLDSYELTISR